METHYFNFQLQRSCCGGRNQVNATIELLKEFDDKYCY